MATYCLDCKWLRLRVDFDEGSGYQCVKSGKTLTGPLLYRRSCRDFAPETILPAE